MTLEPSFKLSMHTTIIVQVFRNLHDSVLLFGKNIKDLLSFFLSNQYGTSSPYFVHSKFGLEKYAIFSPKKVITF